MKTLTYVGYASFFIFQFSTDASNVTYSAGKTKLYVMNPDEDSVTSAKLKLNEILEED